MTRKDADDDGWIRPSVDLRRSGIAFLAFWAIALILLSVGGSIVAGWSVVGGYDLDDAILGLSPANLSDSIATALWTAVLAIAASVYTAINWARLGPGVVCAVGLTVVVLRTAFFWMAWAASAAC